jgi:hypothetical protein
MVNSFNSKKLSCIAILFVVLAGVFLAYWTYTTLMSEPEKSSTGGKAVELKLDEFKALTEIKNYGEKVTTSEPGYGRINPFAPVN